MRLRHLEFGTRSPTAAQRVKPEGRVHEMGLLEKLRYLQKYFFQPNPNTTSELYALFRRQASLRNALREEKKEAPPGARLGFFGDLMWIRNGWGEFLAGDTTRILRELDGLVGNLETAISPAFPVKEFWPDLLRYNSDPRLVQSFAGAEGKSLFAALSFANNHTLDCGDRGALDTLKFLESEGIPHAGVRRDPTESTWAEFERGGIRFGFYAATFGLNDHRLLGSTKLLIETVPNLSPPRANLAPDLSAARAALTEMTAEGVDIKIISLHWGHEFDFFPAPYQREVAAALVAAGADIVMGAHSHVCQPDEIFFVNGADANGAALAPESRLEGAGPARRALVLYGLGNFTTAMYTAPCRFARVAEIEFRREKNGVGFRPPRNHFFFNEAPAGGAPRALRPARETDPGLAQIRAHLGD